MRLDDLLLRFTDKHPDVVAASETLAQLKLRQAAELEALSRGDPGAVAKSGLASNPVYQTIQLQLNQTDVEIAAARGELAQHERAVSDLKRLVNTAPEVEAEFSRLNRDYDVTKAQYNSLVERLEKAKLSDDAQQTGIVRFEIIDPPNSPLEPVAPKRPLMLALVLLAAIAGGVGIGWLLSQLRPVFTSTRGLADATGVPVYGYVTVTTTERLAAEIQRSVLRLAGAGGALVALFVVVLLLHQPGTALMHRLVNFG
jgi:polysaccharide chain length determinant protein (PEP-CTERM system associated)